MVVVVLSCSLTEKCRLQRKVRMYFIRRIPDTSRDKNWGRLRHPAPLWWQCSPAWCLHREHRKPPKSYVQNVDSTRVSLHANFRSALVNCTPRASAKPYPSPPWRQRAHTVPRQTSQGRTIQGASTATRSDCTQAFRQLSGPHCTDRLPSRCTTSLLDQWCFDPSRWSATMHA